MKKTFYLQLTTFVILIVVFAFTILGVLLDIKYSIELDPIASGQVEAIYNITFKLVAMFLILAFTAIIFTIYNLFRLRKIKHP